MIARLALIAALAIAAPAHADPLQDRVLAGIRAADTTELAFTQTTRIERTGGTPQEFASRYDPRGVPGKRWTLIRVDGRVPTAKESADAAKRTAKIKVPSYADLAEWFGAPATRVAQTPGSVTYRFARLPAGVLKMGSHDASADTVADAVVNTAGRTPYVERVRLTSGKPFRLMLVAKVERYVFTGSYTLLGDGRPFPAGTDADMAGSLMGKAGTLTTRTRYGDVRPTR